MLANDVTPERLRRLADHNGRGKVLSVFVNLDPREFATGRARASQIRSVIDRAGRIVEEQQGLSHEQLMALRSDLERVQQELEGDPNLSGAQGLAVYASSPSGLFETLRLPAPIEHDAVVDETPCVEPVAAVFHEDRWAVVLVNRQSARLLYGTRDTLQELALVESDVHGQHDQGGWSQARYQRSVDKDVHDHLKEVAETARRRLDQAPLAGVIVGGPEETVSSFEQMLHPYLRDRLAGRLSVDVEHSTPDEVREAAARQIDVATRRREDQLIERLKARLARPAADSPAAAGLADVLEALTEQRVDTLLLDENVSSPGVICPRCGWMAPAGETCPADGTPTQRRQDILQEAIDRAIEQSAAVVVLRDRPDLAPHDHVAAILRF
jgi:peptide chain release factor subunit 1